MLKATWFPMVLVVCGGVVLGQEAQREADVKTIQGRTAAFVKALADGDAKAVAGLFTSGGEYTRDGGSIRGREELTKAYANFLKDREDGLQIEIQSEEVRFPSPDTAIEEGRFYSKNRAPSSYEILWAREDGEWRIAVLRETSVAPTLSELDWLLGTWEVEREGAKVRTTYNKVPGGGFVKMEYTVEVDGEKSSGSQMIGLDAETATIRSWLFHGDGGHGTGIWSRNAKGWEVVSIGTTAEGEPMAAVNVLTPVDENSFTFQSTQRTVGGEALPDGKLLKVTRVKSAVEE